jgi:membrane protease YdiL (CAAX protease family)
MALDSLKLPETAVTTDKPALGGSWKIFIGSNGIRAGWRLALFLVFLVGLQLLLVQFGLRKIPTARAIARSSTAGTLTAQFQIMIEGAGIIVLFLATAIMSRIERRPFGAYGIPLQNAFGRTFWQGVLAGLAFESIEMLVMSALGGFSFGTLALAGGELIKFAALWAIAFLFVGVLEEFLFRGYAQFTLGTGIGFWPAAILMSILFGAVHISNPGEGWVGALSVALFGLFACFTLRRTGSLWFAIGFHAATDYAESFIFSAPDSGLLAEGHLLASRFHGPRWLTGGTVGPEGSALDFALFILLFVAFAKFYPAKDKS